MIANTKQQQQQQPNTNELPDGGPAKASGSPDRRRSDLGLAPKVTPWLLLLLLLASLATGQVSAQYQRQYNAFTTNLNPVMVPQASPSYRQLGPGSVQAFGRADQAGPPFENMNLGRPNNYVEKVIWPYDSFDHELYSNGTTTAWNVIERKRYVESVSSRCLTSTAMEDPMLLEPSFILIKPRGETRLPATSHASRILAAGYEPHKPTVVLVHGFTQSYPNTTWLRQARGLFERYQRVPHLNLIIMDWSPAAGGSYGQAAAMVSGMGSFLANFLGKLFGELGTDRQSIHLIGHSLGAHLVGFAGKRIRPRIGRITGLDAAGPCFGKILSNSPTDRLSPDDAIEVDVYHYDDDFLGLPGQHGQFDVYVNGGSNQPGCTGNVNAAFGALVTMVFRLNRVLSESHTRSTEVATVPLSDNYCQLVAYECRDYNSFTLGECARCDDFNGQCFLMSFPHQYNLGEDPNTLMMMRHDRQQQQQSHHLRPPLRTSFPGKRLYIQTSEKEAYCLQHYQVLVKFEPSPELAQQAKRQKWRLHVEMSTDMNQRMNFTAQNQMAPNVFSHLLLNEGRPARIRSAQLQVRTHGGAPVPLAGVSQPNRPPKSAKQANSFQVFAIEVQFMSDIDPQVRRLMSSRLCPSEELNSIADSSSSAPSEWLHLEECL